MASGDLVLRREAAGNLSIATLQGPTGLEEAGFRFGLPGLAAGVCIPKMGLEFPTG